MSTVYTERGIRGAWVSVDPGDEIDSIGGRWIGPTTPRQFVELEPGSVTPAWLLNARAIRQYSERMAAVAKKRHCMTCRCYEREVSD